MLGDERGAWSVGLRGLCIAVLLSWLGAVAAPAQPLWTGREAYVDARLGFAAYGGERRTPYDDPFRELVKAGGPGIGLEGGFTLSSRWSIGAFLLSSRYPNMIYVRPPESSFEPIVTSRSSDWIHKLGLLWRRRLHPERRFVPYVQAGGSLAFSLLNNHVFAGGGPRLGAGVEAEVMRSTRFFVEVDGIFVVPGNAMDLAGSATSVDFFSFFGFGLRHRLRRAASQAAVPARIYNVFGADRLLPGEQGVYAADVRLTGDAALTYRWDFGDGTTAASSVATHHYLRPGTYTVTFTVSAGDWEEARTLVTTVDEPVVPVEVVAIHTSSLVPRVGEPIVLTPVLTGSDPIACRWDFGDGARAEGCEASHQYVEPGTYTVLLEASNARSAVRSTREVTVRENPCGDLVRLHPVYFGRNQSELGVDARGFLRQNIARLAECPGIRFEVRGYAEPGEAGGRRLARERAGSVVQYYLNLGIPADRIRQVGDGEVVEVPRGDAVWQYRFVESILMRP